MRRLNSNEKTERTQIKSLNPQNDVETDAQVYGDDSNISTQIVTNYYYNSKK
ncbi:hypothetical protein [Clostridium thailandense]|uniref:Uncharacterized protein n=1 Tax=Clostridium thailandense TaxID=2794346 RepID=A0A949WSK6_9CLOT|nr:hypothetical protein [Clostridium thailandense]MBV7275285.1 hypothetical protein [Clostridium thailandense]MCH5135801.1 hypothetical protein [Clostridiaceae bacterium UIB06]